MSLTRPQMVKAAHPVDPTSDPVEAAATAPRTDATTAGRSFTEHWAAVWIGRVVVLVAFLAVWELVVRQKVLDEFDVSRPSLVWRFLVENVPTQLWWLSTWVTFQELIIGVVVGAAAGIVAGAILGVLPYASRVLDPYIIMVNSVPRVAIYPLMLTWFGLGIGSKIALVIGIVFFIMLVNTRAGMLSADPDVVVAARVLGANRWQRIARVDIPSAVPSIFGGLRLSISYGLLAVIAGEMLAAYKGLGERVSFFSSNFNTTGVMGVLVFLAIIATLLNIATGIAETRLLRWQSE